MSAIGMLGMGAVAVVIAGWLAISFSEPSPRRTRLEWLSACALYVALLAFFIHLVQRAQAAGNSVAAVALGFLVALFATGLVLGLFQLLRTFRRPAEVRSSATN